MFNFGRKQSTKRMRTRLRLSPITSSDEAGVLAPCRFFTATGSKSAWRCRGCGSFPRQTAPPAVMVTSRAGYELHFLTSVQFCTPSTSPVWIKHIPEQSQFKVPIEATAAFSSPGLPCRLQHHVVHWEILAIIRGLIRDHASTIRSRVPTRA